MTDSEPHAERAEGEQARRVLLDLPPGLWDQTARRLRRALGRLPRAELPSGLRPFADWKPDRWRSGRPRQALAAALADEPQLRDALAEELPDGLSDAADDRDATRLAADVGDEPAAAALIASARWDDLAALGAEVAAREAGQGRAAAEPDGPGPAERREAREVREERDRLLGELSQERRERRRLRDELEAARRRAGAAESDRDELRARVRDLEAQLADLEQRRREAHRRHRDREQRLRRRAERAEARAQLDPAELAAAAEQMGELAARLRRAAGQPDAPAEAGEASAARDAVEGGGGRAQGGDDRAAEGDADAGATIPRAVPPAEPGRPCRLPAGVAADSPDGLRALLQVPQITLLVDGYNVTKHPHGRPHASLAAQRDWLVQLAGGLVARYRCRPVLVFDGTDPGPGRSPTARGVRVVFSEGEEQADDRLVELLDGLPPTAPACVVTSDREVAGAAEARHADVVGSATFLEALA